MYINTFKKVVFLYIKNQEIVNSSTSNDTTQHTNDESYTVIQTQMVKIHTSDEESDLNSANDINDEFVKDTLSPYEIERLERIERNKRKFEEIFGHEKQEKKARNVNVHKV